MAAVQSEAFTKPSESILWGIVITVTKVEDEQFMFDYF